MEVSINYFSMEKRIFFEESEDPSTHVGEGWEIVDREEPSVFRGLINPGVVLCRPSEQPPKPAQLS